MEQDLGTMVSNMKEFFEEEIDDRRQYFEAHLEEVKVTMSCVTIC